MNHPKLAIQPPAIALSMEETLRIQEICRRTLSVRPDLSAWISEIEISPGVRLPFLPIRCFRLHSVSRYQDKELSSIYIKTFRSSGSTQNIRAAHHLGPDGLTSYRNAAITGFLDAASRLGIPRDTPIVSLVPPPLEWPESSLAAMLQFWSEDGLDVRYCNVEADPGALQKVFSDTHDSKIANQCIVFGTSLHLLHCARWFSEQPNGQPFIHSKEVWFFDTGGTKGRTINTDSQELRVFMRDWVSSETRVHFLSEYGMSELSSQAYSLSDPHNGVFQCSPTLRSVIVSPNLRNLCADRQLGFLGFIDLANEDSWPLIITEDLGSSLDEQGRIFALAGRAPDATIKGCSLNVKSTFRFDLSAASTPEHPQLATAIANDKRQLFSAGQFIEKLHEPAWNDAQLNDLQCSMENWRHPSAEQRLLEQSALAGEIVAITASANIPLSWFFPAVFAWLMGAARVDLHLPSVRQEDPISDLVRRQIIALADAFNECTNRGFIQRVSDRLSLHTHAHRALIFGHDETIQAIRRALSTRQKSLPVIGLGHFQNKLTISENETPERLAEVTTRWLGRGCLTPLFGVLPDPWSDSQATDFIQRWLKASAELLTSKRPSDWSERTHSYCQTAHRHNLAELRAIAHLHNLNISTAEEVHAQVVGVLINQATGVLSEPSKLDEKLLDWGGCGWFTFIRERQMPSRWRKINTHNPNPGLWETHQGLTWNRWLLNDKHTP